LRVERKALCLLGIVMLGLSATGTANPVAAERPGAAEAAPESAPGAAEQGYGKLGTAYLPVNRTAEEDLKERLAARGMKLGSPIMIRIFKSEAELEVWMRPGDRFELFATYPICNWAGTLGPKLTEGDKQSPEGLYSIGRRQLHYSARWQRSLDIGYPNAFDRLHARTGSSILVHGGCTSTGCFAMTDQVMEQIFRLSRAALWNGQKRIAVHIFPFRMTPENMAAYTNSQWQDFWANLKQAYDLFEYTRLPPTVKVCDRRYVVTEADDDDDCPVVGTTALLKQPLATPKSQSVGATLVSHHPGRGVRSAIKAYAEARKARLASVARHAKHPKQGKPRHAQSAGYRKLPR
jgi:murein L,D-transpeptidase YafK